MKRFNSIVKMHDDYVEKFISDPDRTATKYRAVREISQRYGFRAPSVLSLTDRSVLLERLELRKSLRDIYISGFAENHVELFERAGVALALLHSDLKCERPYRRSLSPQIKASVSSFLAAESNLDQLPSAILHGDYSFVNVFECEDQKLGILDPCPNFGTTFDEWEIGPIYIDIGKMLSCLEGQVPFGDRARIPSKEVIWMLQSRFLEGYCSQGVGVDIGLAHAFAYAVSRAQFLKRFPTVGAFRHRFLYNRFRQNYPLKRKMEGAP